MRYKWILLILIIASALRLYALPTSPPSLYWEEVALGYDAFSILQTGKDHHGNSWPIVAFESFGDWKPSLYFYSIVPFLPFFGLSTWAVRLPAVVAGVSTVLLVYLIVKELHLGKKIALMSSLTLAILPWHLHFSRAGFEVTLATMFLCLGVLGLLKARSSAAWMYGGVISLVLSMYSYHGLRLLAPLVGLLILVVYGKQWFRTLHFWLAGFLGILLLIPALSVIQTPQVQQRITETSFFAESLAVEKSNLWRQEDGNTLLSRFIHHRYWYWSKEIADQALSHFNLDFLFLTGDTNPRHQTGYFALLYHWMIVPLLIGGYQMLTEKKYRSPAILILGWILLATIPPALTKTTPHTLRFLPASPAFAVVIGLGLVQIWEMIKTFRYRYVATAVIVGVICIEWFAYSYDYFLVYPKRSSQEWQYGYQQVMEFVQSNRDQYNRIIIERNYGRPSMYALFYLQIDPDFIQSISDTVPKDQSELLAFDLFEFSDSVEAKSGDLLVSTSSRNIGTLVDQISFLDNTAAFYIYEIK